MIKQTPILKSAISADLGNWNGEQPVEQPQVDDEQPVQQPKKYRSIDDEWDVQ